MATTTQLRADIDKLKKAIASKFTPKSAKPKLEAQLKRVEKELADKKSGKTTTSTTASTKATFKSLKDLVRRTKELSIYKGSSESNLQNDAERKALPSSAVKGRRVSQGLRSNQYGDKGSNKGHIYYEYRKNRIDVKQPKSKQRYPILEDGGMMADGGKIGSYRIIPYKIVSIKGSPDLAEAYYSLAFTVEGSLSEANEKAQKFVIQNENIFSATVTKIHPSGQALKNKKVSYVTKDEISKYEDGGMMAKGGMVTIPNEDKKNFLLENLIDSNINFRDDNYPYYRDEELSQIAKKYGYKKHKNMANSLGYFMFYDLQKLFLNKYGGNTYRSGAKDLLDVGMMAKGGTIPNNYEGKSASEVWEMWSEKQKSHFLLDHSELLDNDRMVHNLGYSRIVQKDMSYSDLTPITKRVLEAHIEGGQYADGGMMAKGGKLKVNGEDFSFLLELSDNELSKKLDLVRKQKNINAKQYFSAREKGESTTKIEESGNNLDNQERAIIEARIRKNKMADGGMMAKGGDVGKDYNVMYNVGKVKYLVNFHDGVKKYDDGSAFYDIRSFKNKRDLNEFISKLKQEGYKGNYADGGMAEMGMEMPNGGGIQSSTHKLHR